MSVAQNRMKAAIARIGETFTVGAVSCVGVFSSLPGEQALAHVTQAEFDASKRPLRLIAVPFDDLCSVGDSFSWNGNTLTIKSIKVLRFRGETIGKILAAIVS